MNKTFLCLAPGQIGSMRTRNRLVYPAMETNYCAADGTATDRFTAYHRVRAAGGIGLCITEATMITPDGRSFPNQLGIYSDDHLPGLCRFTEAMHSTGAKVAVQLFYPGRQTNANLSGIQPMGPSETIFSGTQVRAMTLEDIERIKHAFAEAASRAVHARFDAIELHGGNGYIFQQFHSRFTNKREDEYGGSLINRIRFTKEVVQAIRARIGINFPIIMRLGVYEPVENGLELYEGLTIAKLLVKEKIDALHVTAGMREAGYLVTPPAAMPEGTLLHYAKGVRLAIAEQKPVIGIGRILSLSKADEAIARGDVDFVTMGRAFIADPHLIEKTLSGQEKLIIPCISCNEGCMRRLANNKV